MNNVSGIYQITNKVNGKFYIGSAVNVSSRWSGHISDLKKNKHANQHLQFSWNMYGEDVFDFSVLEECEKENLLNREQYYIDILLPEYNICHKARSRIGTKNTEKTIEKMREIQRNKSPEWLAKISIGNKGKTVSQEVRARISLASKGKIKSLEFREKMSIVAKNKSPEHRRKLSIAQTGKSPSEETRAKISLTLKKRNALRNAQEEQL